MAAEPKSSKAFDQAILRVIRTKKLSVSGETILLAVSGGMDSMVMLDSLHRLSPLLGCELAVAHFNHQLRGSASRRDAELVGKIAKKMGLQFVEGRGDVRRLAKAGKQSVEMAAREMRHGFLIDAAKKLGSHKIALAHHADDQVEQFLLRLFRGAGADGLSGLRWISPSPFDSSFELFRPLLGVSKPAILAQAKRNKISFRKDATNESKKILRNRIRLELLPLIRKSYQTAINSIIRREMEILGDDDALLNEIADDWKAKKTLFSSLPTAIQRRVLMKQFRESGIDPNFEWIERLREGPWRAVVVRDGMSLIVTERGWKLSKKRTVICGGILSSRLI